MPEPLSCPQGHRFSTDPKTEGCPVCAAQTQEPATLLAPPPQDPDNTLGGPVRLVEARPASSNAPNIRGYEILAELGRGATGVVYRARHIALDRQVALKIVRTGPLPISTEKDARLRREAGAAACLQHPNVVQIYEVGEHDGCRYFSLELVEGGSLASRLGGAPLPSQQAAGLVETLARAVHYLHERGILHRDLKPANILLTLPAADDKGLGTPKISDFGLAKRLDSDAALTQGEALLGTPSYMAPEQAGGRGHEADARTDVYGLGAILYELLTGRPPFKAATALDTALQVVSEEVVPPRRLQSRTPRDLETICLKCLEKDPARRYRDALALADDLHRFQNREPIRARPAGAGERLAKWARRRPALASLVACLVLAVSALVAVALWRARELRAYNAELRAANEGERLARERESANYQRARQAVRDLLTEVGRKDLANVPHMDAVRRGLLEKALAFRQGFLREHSADPAIRLETGQAAYDVGDVYDMLGQHGRAEESYRQAVRVLEELADQYQAIPDYRWEAALAWRKLGSLLDETGRRQPAEDALRHALGLIDDLKARSLTDPRYREEEAAVASNLGLTLVSTGRVAEAEACFRRAIGVSSKLAQDFPETAAYRERLANSHTNLGVLLKSQHKGQEAEAEYQAALALLGGLVREAADNRWLRARLALTQNNYGNLLHELGRIPDAEKAYRLALAGREKLVADFPGVPEFRHDLAVSMECVGQMIAGAGRPDDGLKLCRQALDLKDKLAAELPSVLEYRSSLGLSLQVVGQLLGQQKHWPEAQECFARAVRAQREVLSHDAHNPRTRELLRDATWYLADAQLQRGDPASAARTTTDLAAILPQTAEDEYNAACLLARCVPLIGRDAQVPAARRQQAQQALGDRAMDLLRQAVARGYHDVQQLRKEPELEALRNRDDFRKLVAGLDKPRP